MRRRNKLLVFVAVVALAIAAVPAVVLAVGGTFIDDDTSIFEADIEWLAGADVTKGCNPPTNDRFCPDDEVTRGQMAAFMKRFAAFLGAEDGVVDEADEADTLDGKHAAALDSAGLSVFHDAAVAIAGATVLELTDIPAGSYIFIGKTSFNNPTGSNSSASCKLIAAPDFDEVLATVSAFHWVPASFTVVHTFATDGNSVTLECAGFGSVTANDTKITAIEVNALTNTPG